MSAEKTPTLWGTLPAFEGLMSQLRHYQIYSIDHPTAFEVIENGIKKLKEYEQETTSVPAYTLSLCEYFNLIMAFSNIYFSIKSNNKAKLI